MLNETPLTTLEEGETDGVKLQISFSILKTNGEDSLTIAYRTNSYLCELSDMIKETFQKSSNLSDIGTMQLKTEINQIKTETKIDIIIFIKKLLDDE
jgi:hypothetical protein